MSPTANVIQRAGLGLLLTVASTLACATKDPVPSPATAQAGSGGRGARGTGGRGGSGGPAGGSTAGSAAGSPGSDGSAITPDAGAAAPTPGNPGTDAALAGSDGPMAGGGGSGGAGGASGAGNGSDAAPADPSSAPPADAAPADANGVAQTPPQGRRLLDPWLAAGHYRAWKCEAAPVNARAGSPHGRTRICSNDLASGHGAGPYPVGAASVKEIFYGARVGVYAVAVKISPGTTGNAWYWYEQGDLEGVGAAGCTGCHSRTERAGGHDFVFIQVK